VINEAIVTAIVETMNRALAADHDAVRTLVLHRVTCNGALAGDPTIQADGAPSVSVLGVLNGVAGIDESSGWGGVAALFEVVCDDHGKQSGRTGERCASPSCGRTLVLGRLEGFESTAALRGVA
jgi:hypothetical protein